MAQAAIGPSGSRKSTLARALIGVWRLAAGKVRLIGAALDRDDPDLPGGRMGDLPQRVSLFDGTTAETIARLQGRPNGARVVEPAQKAAVHAARTWSARGPLLWGFLTLLVVVGGLGTRAVMTNLAGTIIASGPLGVEQKRQDVQHPDGGEVAEINVPEGRTVQARDTLSRLDGKVMRSELSIVENRLFEIVARRARPEAERDDADGLGFNPERIAAASRPEAAELTEGQVNMVQACRATLVLQIDQMARRNGQITNQIAETDAQSTALLERLDLRAPVSGVMPGVSAAAPRPVIRPADPVPAVIPQDRPPAIAARVPSIRIDQTHVGQAERLHLTAFSARATEEMQGSVVVVVADATTDKRTQRAYLGQPFINDVVRTYRET